MSMTEDSLQNPSTENLEKISDEVLDQSEANQSNSSVDENNSEIDKTSQEIMKLKAEVEEAKDKYLRLFAEFDNFKKRTMKERLDLIKTASQETMIALLPVVDDFERAKKAADAENSTEKFSEGVNLVYHKFVSTLEQKGLKIMESNGEVFDVEKHEALTEIPAPTPEMAGKVIDTIERGYYLHDKIIRYAKVVVGK
jgi:molecular chaperone GrpE